jgi:hypothetical protein
MRVEGASQFPLDPPDRAYTANQGVQLPMFMTAQDMRDSITIAGDEMAGTRSPREVLGLKSFEAQMGQGRGGGVYDSIKEEGVGHPVQLIHTDSDIMMGDGHHRVGSAIDQMKSGIGGDRYMPVIHTDRPDMKPVPGYDTPDIKEAIGDAHNYRNYSDTAWLQHQQFKARQRGEEF